MLSTSVVKSAGTALCPGLPCVLMAMALIVASNARSRSMSLVVRRVVSVEGGSVSNDTVAGAAAAAAGTGAGAGPGEGAGEGNGDDCCR